MQEPGATPDCGVVRMVLALLAFRAVVCAQTAATSPPVAPSIASQLESVQKQRDAVRKQLGTFPQTSPANGFFTAPWSWTMQSPRVAAVQADCDPMPDIEISSLIDKAAGREGVNPKLIRAVIRQESAFRPCAVSAKGAQGLMQLMPDTSQRFHVADPFDPAQNVDAGTKFLKELLAKYAGDLRLALSAYNAGVQRVTEAGNVPDIQETQDYITNILNDMGVPSPDQKTAAAGPAPGST